MSLRGPYKVVLMWLKFDRGGVQQTRKLEPLQKSDNRLLTKNLIYWQNLMIENGLEM